MNELIKSLAGQAGYTPLSGFDFANELQEVFLKKFAELIVKECINEIHGANASGNLNLSSYYLDKVAEHIENHFGVE